MSSRLKAELAATCSTLGRLHKGEYLIEPECIESVKELIRYLKRDNESHEIRRYLGESKILQNDLIHIIKTCSVEMPELFDVTLRLLINLTTPTLLFYGEEVPAEKVARNIYLSLVGYGQEYKEAFCDVDFWNKICGKLTSLFETDWTERSADDGIQIERMLMLLRNVLQVPADLESERRPENDITIHDKVLWALRQSQILELLLFVSSNSDEEQYYLNLLEIFSLILREQNPKFLAQSDLGRSDEEKKKDLEDLIKVREIEKKFHNKYLNTRNFNATFVMKGVKSMANNDIVCHRPLNKVANLDVGNSNKKQVKARRNDIPVESDRGERRSAFSVRLFLKEFSMEFLNSGFNHLMNVVKNRLDSGRSLAHDQSYYFWALKFFLDFTVVSGLNFDLIKNCLCTESFHFAQTSMDSAFEHLTSDKKKKVDWVKRIHLILKAYHSLLEALLWMDNSKSPVVRSMSREMKSTIFYVVEYREMTINLLLKYDQTKFSLAYLRDLVETTHLFVKLLEGYSKETKLVVQEITKKRVKKKKKQEADPETKEEKWDKIKDDLYDILSCESTFPEIPPFDAALDVPIDDQKGRAMKNIQKLLHEGKIRDAVGLLRSARQVWPENDYFGSEEMVVEDEIMALQEICLADLTLVEGEEVKEISFLEKKEVAEEIEEGDEKVRLVEHEFDIMDYKKRLVNKKVVEGCGILLRNYKNNSDQTNHCIIKLLHRIGWECCMPAMLYQASLFWTLLKISQDKSRNYAEINTFTVNLMRKFRKHASHNPVVFLDLLFWKESNVALEIQHGYEPYEDKKTKKTGEKKSKKSYGFLDIELSENEDNQIGGLEMDGNSKKGRKKRKNDEKKPRRRIKQKTGNDIPDLWLAADTGTTDNENFDDGDVSRKPESGTDLNVGSSPRKKNQALGSSDKGKSFRKTKSLMMNVEEGESLGANDIAGDTDEEGDSDDVDNDEQIKRLIGNFERSLNPSQVKTWKNKKRKRGLIDSSEDDSEREEIENKENVDTLEIKSPVPKTCTRSNRGISDSSDGDEDGEGKVVNSFNESMNSDSRRKNEAIIDGSDDDDKKNEVVEKEENANLAKIGSQASDFFPKKRAREKEGVDDYYGKLESRDNSCLKSKRVKYISSDSDIETYRSGEEEPVVKMKGKGRRKRLAVIDSDSDENHSTDGDNIRS